MKKIIYAVAFIIIIVLILLNVFSLTNTSLFGYRLFKVKTGSMEPTINTGNLILVEEKKEYKEEDIVTYIKDGSYITHRIIKIENDEVITKGDNNNTEDEPFNKENIVGKMIYEFKFYTFILFLIKNPIFWILAMSIVIVIILIKNNNKERS